MSSVNIAIKEEAYSFLRSLKAKDESFSDVILRLKLKKAVNGKALIELRNEYDEVLKNVDLKNMENRMKEFREEVEKRMDETAEYMKEARAK